MKITKKSLIKLIEEEISRALNENEMTLGQALNQSSMDAPEGRYPPIKIIHPQGEELYVQVKRLQRSDRAGMKDTGFAVNYGTLVQHGSIVGGSTLDGSDANREQALANALVSLKGHGVTAETPAKILKGPAPDQSTGMERFR